jgi:hypothetical protein
MTDPALKSKIFHGIVRRLTQGAGNLSISTNVRMLDEGWVNTDSVYEDTLLPLISLTKRIYLAGYKQDWLGDISGDLPVGSEWAKTLSVSAIKVSKYYFLPHDVAADQILKKFWVQPYFYVPRTDGMPGNTVVRPAVAVLEFDVNEIPVNSLIQGLVSLSTISNLWSGGRYQTAAKRWCSASKDVQDSIFLPYKDLGNFTFTGSAETVGSFVDLIMIKGGIAQKYEELSSDQLLENMECKEEESIDECIERILNYI